MIYHNSFYGHRDILCAAIGLPSQPMFASIQHGWWLTLDIPYIRATRPSSVVPLAVWSGNDTKELIAKGLRNISAIGAPFLYLPHSNGDAARREGTLFFPAHSSGNPGWTYDFKEELLEIEQQCPAPYTAVLYYENFLAMRKVFDNRPNWTVMTMGHRIDPLFLYRLKALLSRSSVAVTTELMSATWYSLVSGLSLYRTQAFYESLRSVGSLGQMAVTRSAELFDRGSTRDDLLGAANRNLGKDAMRGGDELREIFFPFKCSTAVAKYLSVVHRMVRSPKESSLDEPAYLMPEWP